MNVAIFCALIERPHCDVFQTEHLHMELEVTGAAHMKPLDMCVEEQPLGGPLEDAHGHHRKLRYPDKWQNLLQLAKCGRSGDDDGQRLQARASNVLQNGRQVQIFNKDFQASQVPAQSLAKLKQKMAVEDLGTMQFLFALVTDARDPCASSVSGAEGQLLQPRSD